MRLPPYLRYTPIYCNFKDEHHDFSDRDSTIFRNSGGCIPFFRHPVPIVLFFEVIRWPQFCGCLKSPRRHFEETLWLWQLPHLCHICCVLAASSGGNLRLVRDLGSTFTDFFGGQGFFLAILGRWMTQNPTFQGWEDVHFMGLANPFQHVPLGRCGFHLCSMEATTSPRNESPLLVAFWMQGFTVEPASQRRDSMDLRNGQEPTWMV